MTSSLSYHVKTIYLTRVIRVCACMFLLLPKAKAQDTRLLSVAESIKAGFTQQGYQSQLVTAWSKENELVWEPQWNALFSAQVQGKEVQLVPLQATLQSKTSHNPLKFKLIGTRKYLLVTGEGAATTYQFLTLAYDDKKNQAQEDDLKFLATFNGTILRQAIGKSYVAASIYENGQRQAMAFKPVSANPNLSALSKTTSGVTCEDVFTCYWSCTCYLDGVVYGSITTGTGFCSSPSGSAGPCYYSATWTLTESDSYQDCHYDNADFNPDWGPGPVPANRPCPGDPLVAMNIAASSPGNPGNIRGGTFGPDVRSDGKGHTSGHEGVDIEAVPGTPVYAGIAGEVIGIRSSFAPGEFRRKSYGNYVYVHNVDGTYSKYNHLDGITQGLAVGDKINRGVQIGTAGTTGNAAAKSVIHKHLHLQMFDSSQRPTDPMPHVGTPMDKKTGRGSRPC